ncbi:MAG: hypothetical protein PF638_13025 [Candidatus Delongbacteria bacterium]|jgi:hypothetical protein|nr:hypothetical protein [Candidatus Delongbacteria bacterium]
MLNKYNWITILIFIGGILLFVEAQNNFENPLPSDMDNMHKFNENHPKGEEFEHGKRREFRSKKITAKLEKRINEVLRDHFPEFHNKAIKLKKEHPSIYRGLLRKLKKHIRRTKEPKEEKIELVSMIFEEAEVDILLSKFKNSKNKNEKAELKAKIREKLSKGFDKRENIQKKVISRIEKNIEKKKKNHQDRILNKEKLINKNLEKLLK